MALAKREDRVDRFPNDDADAAHPQILCDRNMDVCPIVSKFAAPYNVFSHSYHKIAVKRCALEDVHQPLDDLQRDEFDEHEQHVSGRVEDHGGEEAQRHLSQLHDQLKKGND
jgi:hypothetical protein